MTATPLCALSLSAPHNAPLSLTSLRCVCVFAAGAYADALKVFDEQEEMRKSLWKPRFTPVSFSLLLTATAASGGVALSDDGRFRLQYLPRVLKQMKSYRILPRAETCDTLLAACVKYGELETGREVLEIAERAGHELDPVGLAAFERRAAILEGREVPVELSTAGTLWALNFVTRR